MKDSFKSYLDDARSEISNHLSSYCKTKKAETLPAIFKEQGLIDSLEQFALRGKLIRGTLFLLIVESLGVKRDNAILDMACAIELMHSALLIQDDIIDRDKTRRGAKTIFAYHEEEGERLGALDPYHYGISTAIMVGDVAFFFAFDLLTSYQDTKLGALLRFYAHEVYLVCLAESADSLFGQTKREPSREDIYAVYTYKTARYTFSLPFEMASIVGGASDKTRKSLATMGEMIGIIFQLKDDEIGLFGDAEIIGKPVGSDVRENKKTIIRHLLYEAANDSDRKILDSCFGNNDAGVSEVEKVKELYVQYKIGETINAEIESIMNTVWPLYESLEINQSEKLLLKELLEFNLRRTY